MYKQARRNICTVDAALIVNEMSLSSLPPILAYPYLVVKQRCVIDGNISRLLNVLKASWRKGHPRPQILHRKCRRFASVTETSYQVVRSIEARDIIPNSHTVIELSSSFLSLGNPLSLGEPGALVGSAEYELQQDAFRTLDEVTVAK